MKEATGELSNSVVVIICVAILVAFFFLTVWPMLRGNFRAQTDCEKATCNRATFNPDTGMITCEYEERTFECKYKG